MATSTDLRAAIEEVQGQLPAEELDAEGIQTIEPDLATRLERRVGVLPWWVISAVVHAVLFLLATLLSVAMPPPQVDEVTINTDMAKREEPKYDEKKKRDIFKQTADIKHETQIEKPVLLHEEVEVTDHFETDNDMDQKTARGSEDAISDIPLGGFGTTGSIGVGGGGMAGVFGYRSGGGRRKAVARFGGSEATESAVEAALRWLARHQEKDGHWDTRKLESSKMVDTGVTGLAVLAFLGAGYTHKTNSRYQHNVRRGIEWLVAKQQDNGLITDPYKIGYHHPIAGLALAEAFGMTKDPKLKEPAQKAVHYSTNVHQVPYSGWRYNARQGPDTSVTGWFVMQLKSAKIAGLKVDNAGFQGAQAWIEKCTYKDGRVGYTGPGGAPGTTSVGMVCRQFLGIPNTDENLKKGADYLQKHLPVWPGRSRRSYYYWYYGTLAMFQMGKDHWKEWNKVLKPLLVDNQRKGGPMDGSAQDLDGSWDPHKGDNDDPRGGRAYTTALGALILEVYYRYLPMYGG